MASAVPEEVTERLTCAVCMEQFKEPKVLPCLHTYCKACLQKLVKKQGSDHIVTCPECRQDSKVPDGDASKLQPNFWVDNFMTLLSMQDSASSTGSPLICEHCDSGDVAVSRCTTCRVFLCEFCVTAHKRIHAFKSHQILSLAEAKVLGSKALVKPSFCTKHADEILKLFCNTCQKTICRDCTIVDHRSHNYNFVADVVDRERKAIQAVLKETKVKDKAVEEGLKAVQLMQDRINVKTARLHNAVKEVFDELVERAEVLQEVLKKDITLHGQVKLKALGSQKEELAFSLALLRSSADFAEKALADGDDIQLLAMKQQLVQRLAHLNALQVQCKPCENDTRNLQLDRTIMRDIDKMVTLVHTTADTNNWVLSVVGGEEGVLYQTLAGQPVDFVLAKKNGTVGPTELGTKYSVCAIIIKEVDRNQILPVRDNGGYSYLFSYRPETDGLCTLSLTVDGEDVPGCPFTWTVKPEVKSWQEFGQLTSSSKQDGQEEGKHCWKVKCLRRVNEARSAFDYEIGVTCVEYVDELPFADAVTNSCTWRCQGKKDSGYQKTRKKGSLRYHTVCSRSDNAQAKCSITSLHHGDIFSIYVNHNTSKLIIYSHRLREAEVFTGVKGDVYPIISPYSSHDKRDENHFTLII